MRTRRDLILDSAIEILGEQGTRALTHRAVDALAGLPAGSTSNHFRTREALIDGVVDRFVLRERANWEALTEGSCPRTPAELGGVLAMFAREATGPQRTLTLARYAILVEAARTPALRPRLAAGGARVNSWFETWIRVAGSVRPERDLHVVLNYWTGLVLHELAIPDPAFDPTAHLVGLLESLIPLAAAPADRAAAAVPQEGTWTRTGSGRRSTVSDVPSRTSSRG